VELGETLEQALVREMEEETGLRVAPGEVLTVFDRIMQDAGTVRYHYVIVDYLCSYVSGEAHAASDAEAVAWATPEELTAYKLPQKAMEVVQDAFARHSRRPSPLRAQGGTGYPDLK
jgi:ADP-ribose pyrophosphatase YjhB (NUDIX family)